MKKGFWTEGRTIVAIAVCLLALAEIVDLTIVGVALPHIMGALSCNFQEVSLVTTSYIVSAAIFIMLTGYVSNRFGSKKVLLISTLVFGVSSILCGLSTSLSVMVFFRIIQGIGGAFLPALAQGYIAENFNEEERPKMTALLTITMVLGPIIGPVLGGYLVESFNWSWIFYVNVPICLTAFLIIWFKMQETKTSLVKFDTISFAFMAIAFGLLEYFIDEGNTLDWFSSHEMVIIFEIGLVALIFFIWRGLTETSVIDFKIFKNLNFVLSCLYVFIFMTLAASVLVFYPTLMQSGYGFPVNIAGLITFPRGVFAVIGAATTTLLCKYFDKRKLLFLGLALFISANWLQAHYGSTWNLGYHLITSAILGMSMSTTFIILLQVAFTGINHSLSNDASGVFNFFRNIGNSIGTSIASTLLSRQQQVSWHDLGSRITPYNPTLISLQHGVFAQLPLAGQMQLIAKNIQQQTFFIANIDIYYLACVGSLVLVLIPFFLTKPAKGVVAVSMH